MVGTPALPRGQPEEHGIPSAALMAFLDASEREVQHLHSFMLLRHGAVVAEGWWHPYAPRYPHMLFSLSKSFTSTAIGLLVAEGKLSIEAPLLAFFPEEAPAEPDANLRAMQVRHLLSMVTGHATDPTERVFSQPDWVRAFLALPVEREPGSHFVYNTAGTYMLSAIVQRLSGKRLLEYLRPRLLDPLGIEQPTWEMSPQGVDVGGSGLSLTTDAIARFGQLYLQGGVFQGKRLLPEAWVTEATARLVPNGPSANADWGQGYGYQFWRCRHDAYRGDGAFGQFCVVMPKQETVLAITAGVRTLQRVLDLVWEHLLPALGPDRLPEDRRTQEALAQRLAGLHLPPVQGERTSSVAARVSGKPFTLAVNEEGIEAITFHFDDACATVAIRHDQGEQRIACGHREWLRGEAALERPGRRREGSASPRKVAASGAWRDEHTYVAQLWWYETPFGRTLTCRFDEVRLVVEQEMNAAFGPTDRPRLEGQLR